MASFGLIAKQYSSPISIISLGDFLDNGTNNLATSIYGFDPYDANWNANFIVTEVNNIIRFEINPFDANPIDFDLDAEVSFVYKHYNLPDDIVTQKSHTLKINFRRDQHSAFKQIDLLKLSGGQRVELLDIQFSIPGLSQNQMDQLKSIIVLKAYTEDIRYYHTSEIIALNHNNVIVNHDPIKKELRVTWPYMEAAEEYDIRFQFTDSYLGINTNTGTDPVPNIDLSLPFTSNNSNRNMTRISTSNNEIIIPAIEEKTHFFFNIRAVGRMGAAYEYRYEGPWSGSSQQWYYIDEHEEDKLNYQSITSYAEDGKYKIVNQYFDGRMASRQKVTKLQSNDYALVQESIYDYIGRQAIEVLPAPIKGPANSELGSIMYYDNFNRAPSDDEPYHALNFDKSGCLSDPDPMSSISGASHYYSPEFYNSLTSVEQQSELKLIPDALRYPFSQTRFMNDNTNRPLAQGGVGNDHHIGTGRETEITYTTPTQSELDRLFGTEAGIAKYYKKVITEDPNNQISIAYQDLKGNTIATSLYGATDNLDTLETYKKVEFMDELTVNNHIDFDSYAVNMSVPIFVSENNMSYNFDYTLTPAQFTDQLCLGNNICYDCVYDLIIEVKNTDCNETILRLVQTIGFDNNQSIDNICNASIWDAEVELQIGDIFRESTQQDPEILNLILDKGNYTINKFLKVNEAVADLYVDEFVNDPNNTCIKTLADWLSEQETELLDAPCGIDCGQIDPSDAFLAELCDTINNKCKMARNAMISDFMPGGQYAKYEVDAQGNYFSNDPLSIFFSGNHLLDDVNLDYYTIIENQFINVSLSGETMASIITGLWQSEWSEAFLPYHPEYCYLIDCNNCNAEFDGTMIGIETAAQAFALGYLDSNNPENLVHILSQDPFFNDQLSQNQGCSSNGETGSRFYQSMENELNNYFADYPSNLNAPAMSVYDMAVYNVCNGLAFDTLTNSIDQVILQNCQSNISLTSTDVEMANMLWIQIKSIYLSLKEKYEYWTRSFNAINNGCYNGCIGEDPFNWTRNDFGIPSSTLFGQSWNNCASNNTPDIPFFCPDQLCNNQDAQLYKNKIKRFPSVYDIPLMDQIDDIYDLDSIVNNLDNLIGISIGELENNGCVIDSVDGLDPIETGETCIEYACLSELENFLNQFCPQQFAQDNISFRPDENTELELPDCFGGSPFLPYLWTNVNLDLNNGTLSGNLGSIDLDKNLCQIELTFLPMDDASIYAGFSHTQFINAITHFDQFELQTSALDSYGETNQFTCVAHSRYLEIIGIQQGHIPLIVEGTISCAKLGRCCGENVDAGIQNCLNIPNELSTGNIEDDMWIGQYNPYFDPAWVINPCNLDSTGISIDSNFYDLVCTDTIICCLPADSIMVDTIFEYDCDLMLQLYAEHNANELYLQYIEGIKDSIKHAYMTQCLYATEVFNMEHESGEHHFVLSYYDQAGNLSRTVPPNGTYDYYNELPDPDKTFQTSTELDQVTSARQVSSTVVPDYWRWDTRYTYNSLNQITTQNLPDHGSETALNIEPSRDGISTFKYDDLGRLVFSQNPKQADNNKYSYTAYDQLGRIVEAGQAKNPNTYNNWYNQAAIFTWGTAQGYAADFLNLCDKEQITHTYYDSGPSTNLSSAFPNNSLDNLRGRVAFAEYYDTEVQLDNQNAISGSYYSYDELGNVKALTQRLKNGFSKHLEYEYDLVSGNVNKVIYQRNEKDQFIHRYHYDEDNRIVQVETSLDNCIWDLEAKYFYYPHGPLARVELGSQEVQGIDYVYTIHGWIKGTNAIGLNSDLDPGQDGEASGVHASFAPDELGYMLNYYDGDFQSISGLQDFEPSYQGAAPGLYNGNIRNMTTSIGHFIRENTDYGYVSNDYAYDQLNRIKEMRPWDDYDINTNAWALNAQRQDPNWSTQPYFADYSYDGNGNILSLQRNGALGHEAMDDFEYKYDRRNNQLTRVIDQVSNTAYPLDPTNPNAIRDHDGTFGIGHRYDKIGNMIEDLGGGLEVEWNVQGKVAKITDSNGIDNNTPGNKEMVFKYDPLGNRIAKIIDDKATLFVRDAQGNIMSTYTKDMSPVPSQQTTGPIGQSPISLPTLGNEPIVMWKGAYLYGSDRIGEYTANKQIEGPERTAELPQEIGNIHLDKDPLTKPNKVPTSNGTLDKPPLDAVKPMGSVLDLSDIDFSIIADLTHIGLGQDDYSLTQQPSFELDASNSLFHRGKKRYELTNHLSNVLTTITDRKYSHQNGAGTNISEHLTVVKSASDYYPFGFKTPSRNFIGSNYGFGYNGKFQDDEIMGNGVFIDYGFRIYNSSFAKFLSQDPLFRSYPRFSSYQYSQNDPIRNVDVDGLEGASAIEYMLTGAGQDLEKYINHATYKLNHWWNSWNIVPVESSSRPAPSIKKDSGSSKINLTTSDDLIKSTESVTPELSKNIDLSNKVPFVSQFSLERPNVACARASQKILKDYGLSNSGFKKSRIIVAKNDKTNTNLELTPQAKKGIDYINSELQSGNPVMVGVDHTISKNQSDGQAADHFVVIVGKGYDKEKNKAYFTFYEVGTRHKSKGTSTTNRLYVNEDNSITGTNYAGKRNFTVTDVRKNDN